MLNFRSVYEFVFSSFRISRDTELVDQVIAEGERYGLVIKRSWIYGAFSLLMLVPIIALASVNTFLLGKHFDWSPLGYALIGLLLANIAYTAVSGILYVARFRKTYAGGYEIRDLHAIRKSLAEGDADFTRFFNQIQTNFFFFVGIIAFYVVHIVFVAKFSTGLWAVADILCIFAQLALMTKFVRTMINHEMDFNVIVKGRIFFINQKGMYSDTQTLAGDKIKTIRSTYPGFLASYFRYGTVDVLTEGDIGLMGVMTMHYVDNPELAVSNMNLLISGKLDPLEKIHNVYLSKIVSEEHMDRNADDFHERMREYLVRFDDRIRDDYLSAEDGETKREIEELYSLFAKKE